jgi:hypothetical protein
MKWKLFVAALVALCIAASFATLEAQTLAAQVRNFEHARKIDRANIEAMIDPAGSFSVTFWGKNASGQCPINPNWTITVNLRPDIDGIYINAGCPHESPVPCFCDIYVRTPDTKRAWEDAMAPYQKEFKRTLPVDPSPSARIESSDISYSVGTFGVNVPLAVNRAPDVPRGSLLTVAVDASVSPSSESPCSNPQGRPCRLTTELWGVDPDGSRRLLISQFENADQSTRMWIRPGERARVSVKGYVPGYHLDNPVPKGRAVLVGRFFLWKYQGSLFDYKIPVGTFEVPLNISK